ncbi:30S ribosomal protein S14 [Candidatus Legionella polyplacis]|uniref:Small ribosomal subunit protein uS14 n=1 Tax=Candidatus Legionella polyplacis TaxID=2005262 RepID=A0ABZ2H0N2_9GAMM|nr:30S ribosomal protein S14 [Candidatus Legionella polyplacis]ATW01754.1 30S ribosomal protein S14 [Candidatus Legionella polyplacis]
MAKKSVIARINKRKKLIVKYKERRIYLKKVIRSSVEVNEIRNAQIKLSKLPVDSSPVRYNRRCQQCGRSRAIFRKFELCRICLRKQLMFGNVTGGRKSSW